MKNRFASTVLVSMAMMFFMNTAVSAPALAKSHDQGNQQGNQTHRSSSQASQAKNSKNTQAKDTKDKLSQHVDVHGPHIAVQGIVEKISGAMRALANYQQASQVSVAKADKSKHKPHKARASEDLRSAVHFLQSAVAQIGVVESVYGTKSNQATGGVTTVVYTPTTVTGAVYTPGSVIATLQAISAQLQTDETAIVQVNTSGTGSVSGIISDLVQQSKALLALATTTTVILPPSRDD